MPRRRLGTRKDLTLDSLSFLTLITKCRIHSVCNGHSAFCKSPVLSLFLSLLKGQRRPGCHPTLPPCNDSSLLHLSSHSYSASSTIPLPITHLNLGHQRPGCHPTLPPCSSDSSLLHLLAPTPIQPPGLPHPITYLSLGCLGVGRLPL